MMMTVPMDEKVPAPPAREHVRRMFKKTRELENGLQVSAKSKHPSDPNTWYEIRDSYEAIILEDHDSAEKNEVEFLLWQLHYRRIEEFRAHIHAGTQGGINPRKPDHIKKIRALFKNFLSESTGFYHDLIQKIRSKYGLPLGYFDEAPEHQAIPTKDEKRSVEMKKGLLSCHRCLIYLGDLARYKASFGDENSGSRDFAAASSYYMQAVALWSGSGNPHNQLAILASYSGDELVAIYRYFRSLLVDNPFTTARENLIIAFEKNRVNYAQLANNTTRGPSTRTFIVRGSGRGRGRVDSKLLGKDGKLESLPAEVQELNLHETLKVFCTRFVRLNGILFSRTSMETFEEVFSSAMRDFCALLSSGPYEELNFGTDALGNGLAILRLVTILISSVHNVNRESENNSYAEILQRPELLRNAFTAVFEFTGQIVKRCNQLKDAASSYLFPGVLVFMEWLACHPDMATVSDVRDKQAAAWSFFWNEFVVLMNNLLSSGLVSLSGEEDDTSFSDMVHYDEEETENRLALWEDFELRGFLPLVPAQLILDFSRKHPRWFHGSNKEKRARSQRVLAAGRVLMNVVRVESMGIHFDQNLKKFVLAAEPPTFVDELPTVSKDNHVGVKQESLCEVAENLGVQHSKIVETKAQLLVEAEDEEEEIVFKPTPTEKLTTTSTPDSFEFAKHVQSYTHGELAAYGGGLSTLNSMQMGSSKSSSQLTAPVIASMSPLHQISSSTSSWFAGSDAFISDELKGLKIEENGVLPKQGVQGQLNVLNSTAYHSTVATSASLTPTMFIRGQGKAAETFMSSAQESRIFPLVAKSDSLPMTVHSALPASIQAFPATSRKNPVSKPLRHTGPPPGFGNVTAKPSDDVQMENRQQVDDYSWLDGYQPSAGMDVERGIFNQTANSSSHPGIGNMAALSDAISFPFPGKQVYAHHTKAVNEKLQEFQLFGQLRPYSEQQFQQTLQRNPTLEQIQAHSLWSGRYYV